MTTMSGVCSATTRAITVADPLDQGGVAEPAVGKGCVVSDIDDFDVGAKAADFGEHR